MNLFKRLVKFFKNKKPNYSHECGNTYTVRSQNGLNNAIYDFIGCFENGDNTLTKKELREAVVSYPTKYPCRIQIVDMTFECARIHIELET